MSKIENIIIINDFDYVQGGASKVAIDTANLLSDKYNVYYFSGVTKKNNYDLSKNVRKICTNQGECLKDKNRLRGIVNGIYNFKARNELKKILSTLDKNETIIHVHGWTKCLSSSIFDISWKMGFSVILTMHDYFTACPNGGYFNYKCNEICHFKPLSWDCIKCNCDSRNYMFKIYRVIRQFVQNHVVKLNKKMTDVISISDFSEKILKRTLNSNTKIHKLYNPIDFNNKIINKNFKENDYYLNVSRISKEKDVETFCQAITIANKRGIVVGDGEEKANLEENYPNIEFVGWKNSTEVKYYMERARYLVFTSKLYEVSPLTTMEALMMKLPCIVWSGCAAKDQIDLGQNGFVYDDINSLVDIIKNKEIETFKFHYKNNYIIDLIEIYSKVRGEKYEKNCIYSKK